MEIPAVLSRLSPSRLATSFLALLSLTVALAPSIGRGEMVYVTSFSTGELVRFDSADPVGTKTTLVAGGALGNPTSLAFGPDGKLYIGVSEAFTAGTPTIRRYDLTSGLEPTPVYTFSPATVVPGSLAFRGNDLFVGRIPFPANIGPIVRLAGITGGAPVETDYTTGGALASSPGIAFHDDGWLYVSDQTYNPGFFTATGPVKRFDENGNYIAEVIPDADPDLFGPTGLAIVGDTLYTASIMNGKILATDLVTLTTTFFADTMLPFSTSSLAALANGDLLAGDASGSNPSEIYRFNTSGTLVGSYDLDMGTISGIAVAPVPEPSTVVLAGCGIAAAAAVLRRRRRATMTA